MSGGCSRTWISRAAATLLRRSATRVARPPRSLTSTAAATTPRSASGNIYAAGSVRPEQLLEEEQHERNERMCQRRRLLCVEGISL